MTLSQAQRAETLRRESAEIVLVTLEVTHAMLASPLRLCSAPLEQVQDDPRLYGATVQGQVFYFVPFEFEPPEEGESAEGRAKLSISNQSPDYNFGIAKELRELTSRASVSAKVFVTPDLTAPVLEYNGWSLTNGTITDEGVELDLRADDLSHEPAPTGRYDTRQFPGLFNE